MSATEMDDAPIAQEGGPAKDAQEATGLEAVEGPALDDADIAALRNERDRLREQLLRRRAEFENYRRRTERERQSWALDAQVELLKELIPTLDHLEQALRAEGAGDSLHQGVTLIQRDLLATLTRLGLEVHAPKGGPFDPAREHALSRQEAADVAVDTVVETYRPGFVYKDRLLRPALVRVAVASRPETALEAVPASESGPEEVH